MGGRVSHSNPAGMCVPVTDTFGSVMPTETPTVAPNFQPGGADAALAEQALARRAALMRDIAVHRHSLPSGPGTNYQTMLTSTLSLTVSMSVSYPTEAARRAGERERAAMRPHVADIQRDEREIAALDAALASGDPAALRRALDGATPTAELNDCVVPARSGGARRAPTSSPDTPRAGGVRTGGR